MTNTGIGQGSSIAIYGAGPVGLLCAALARMLGAEHFFMVDHLPYRLAYAQQTYNVIPVNLDEDDDPADANIRQTPWHASSSLDTSAEAIITHRMSLEQAAEGYKIFDKKQEDCRKVILTAGRNDVVLPETDSPAAIPAV